MKPMRALHFILLSTLILALAACSKSDTGSTNGGAGATQLNWDQGNWNHTNWQ